MQFRAHVVPQGGSPLSASIAPVPRRHQELEAGWRPFLFLTAITMVTCITVYFALSPLFSSSHPITHSPPSTQFSAPKLVSECCRGIEHQELWGNLAKSGTGHVFDSPEGCCKACKAMCSGDGPCLCNSWVYCGDRASCKDMFGECWLKMQEDPLVPEVHDSGPKSMWTSGLVFGKDMGILALKTEHGSIRIKLLPECAPLSVAFLVDHLQLRHCAGCHFYRAEGRGNIWDATGQRVNKTQPGPPYALVQASLEAQGMPPFQEIPRETCPNIRRGMVGWIGGGPDFFISLANHGEWYPKYTVFAYVLPEDMQIVEKIASLPTTSSVWNGIKVNVLNQFVSLKLQRS